MERILPFKGLVRRVYRIRPQVNHPVFPDDVFLVSYPRSGNTWVSFLLANLMAEGIEQDMSVNFFNVQDFVPEYENPLITLRERGVGGFPRIIKSHSGCNHLFPKVFLIVRDPRDVLSSFHVYLKAQRRIPEGWSVRETTTSTLFGISAWIRHTRGWLERADQGKRARVFRYESFLTHPVSELMKMTAVLGMDMDTAVIRKAAERCGLEHMSQLETVSRNPDFPLSDDVFRFVGGGASGRNPVLPDDVKTLIETEAGDLMRLLGYC